MLEERKFYLSAKGLKKIKREYKVLKDLRLAKTKGVVPKTWESEDVNPEYLSFQEDLNFLEAKIAELENILKNADLIKSPLKKERDKIHLGAHVQVEVDGRIDEFTIVGTLETNPDIGKISSESPIGKALLGHKIGEEVVISSPTEVTYKIVKIKYPSL